MEVYLVWLHSRLSGNIQKGKKDGKKKERLTF
jgi:hypothetical protein